MIKKYLITGLLLCIGSISYAQMMLPAYQGAFSRKIVASGIAGNGLDFDGVDDYVDFPVNTIIPLANSSYTLEAYIKPTIHSRNGIVGWGSYGSSNQVNALRLNDGNGLYNYWWGNDFYVTLDASLADNKWYHIAATFDGTKRKIYVDGVLKGEDSPTGHNVPSAANFRIGSTNNGEFFKGTIDDVRIWNVARTQAQIQANMNKELTGSETGLKAYYTFNQGIAAGNNTAITTVTDKTANALNGSLTNFTKTGATSNFVAGKVESSVITNGLVLNLDANNTASYSGSGATWNDISGNNNNATLNSAAYTTLSGLSYFNFSSTFVNTTLTKSASMTYSVWAKSSSPANCMLFNSGNVWNGATGGPDLFFYSSQTYWNTWDAGNNPFGFATAGIDASWHNYTVVNDASSTAKLYFDGALVGSAIYKPSDYTTNLYIGGAGTGDGWYWVGGIASFQAYNRALIDTEVLQNYNSVKAKFGK